MSPPTPSTKAKTAAVVTGGGRKKKIEESHPVEAPVEAPVETPVETPVDQSETHPLKLRRRQMPRVVREQMVNEIDRAMLILLPLIKRQKKPKAPDVGDEDVVAAVETAKTPKELAKEVVELLKAMRVSLRVRSRRDSAPRKSSTFNLFVRETMKNMKDTGVVFENTTERMKECGRLWKLRKAELAAQADVA